MTFASRMQGTASRLLTTYGQAVTFYREAQGDFNPATGAVGTGTTLSYSAIGHPAPYTKDEVGTVTTSIGTLVQFSDVNLLTYSTTAILIGDTVALDSVVHRVMSVQKVNVQGYNIVYKVQLRV